MVLRVIPRPTRRLPGQQVNTTTGHSANRFVKQQNLLRRAQAERLTSEKGKNILLRKSIALINKAILQKAHHETGAGRWTNELTDRPRN